MFKLVLAFVKKELVQTLRDPRMKIVLFVTPIVQLVLFGLALQSLTDNVRLYAAPQMNDPLFVHIARDAVASKWFDAVEGSDKDLGEDIADFKSGRLDAALYAPEGGLTEQFERGEGRLEAVIDGSDLIRARGIVGYISSIAMNAAAERLGKPESYPIAQMTQAKKESTADVPMEFITRVLYNPEFVTSYSLVPGVICIISCMITIMLTSMSIAKEKEIGTFETLISAPVTTTEILLGKTIPYIIIGCIELPAIFFIAIVFFDVPMTGSYVLLFIAFLFFLATNVSVGTMISIIAKNQQQAMMGSFIFLMPALLLSGIMYPVDNLPAVLKVVSACDPVMYFFTLLRNIMLKGGDPVVMVAYTGVLALIAAVCVTIAFKRFKLHLG